MLNKDTISIYLVREAAIWGGGRAGVAGPGHCVGASGGVCRVAGQAFGGTVGGDARTRLRYRKIVQAAPAGWPNPTTAMPT